MDAERRTKQQAVVIVLASERLAFMRSGSRLGEPGDTRDSLATPPLARQRFLYGPEKLYWSKFYGDKCTNQPEKLYWSTFYGYKCTDQRCDIGVHFMAINARTREAVLGSSFGDSANRVCRWPAAGR